MSPGARCGRCHRRTCTRDGSCESRRARRKRMTLCDGHGNQIGPTSKKVCGACQRERPITTFWNGSDTCRSCTKAARNLCKKCSTRQAEAGRSGGLCSTCRKGHQVHFNSYRQDLDGRMSFVGWMTLIGARKVDYDAVFRAVERYGKRKPTPDDLLEAHLAEHPWQRHGALFHAVVLLAGEQGLKPQYYWTPKKAEVA